MDQEEPPLPPMIPIPNHNLNLQPGICGCHVVPGLRTGHYEWVPGEVISGGKENIQYALLESLGRGGYGQVIRALNISTNKFFALKVIKNHVNYFEAGCKEIGILNMLRALDPKQHYLSTNILCQFLMEGQICFGMELLGPSLSDYINMNSALGFPVSQIRHILYQLVHGLQFLHGHQITHTDIKLENILFAQPHQGYAEYVTPPGGKYLSPRCTRVLLTDFGAAKFGGGNSVGIITTRTTRAPEVILGKSWTFAVDLWALGCILFQLYSGFTLFSACDDVTHLYLMERVAGQFPKEMTETGPLAPYFVDGGVDIHLLQPIVKTELDNHAHICKKRVLHNLGDESFRRMADLFYFLLKIDPSRRSSANEIMEHEFLQELPLHLRLQHGLSNMELGVANASVSHAAGAGYLSRITCGCVECVKYVRWM